MATQISTFTKSGKRLSGVSRPRVPVAQLGTLIDGRLWRRPRLRMEPLEGASVRITNRAASTNAGRNKRTGGLGMGAANTDMQRGRTRDF